MCLFLFLFVCLLWMELNDGRESGSMLVRNPEGVEIVDNRGIVESWNVNHWNGEDSLHDRTFVVATSKS